MKLFVTLLIFQVLTTIGDILYSQSNFWDYPIGPMGGDIRLVKPNEVIKILMEKAGTLNVFNLYDSINEAIKSFEINGD
jgi:hypothetical protein